MSDVYLIILGFVAYGSLTMVHLYTAMAKLRVLELRASGFNDLVVALCYFLLFLAYSHYLPIIYGPIST